VRYISNRSSGKMGYALAVAATREGAEVTLVSGPVALAPPQVECFIGVESADEMFDAVMRHAAESDIFIACAAVSDYRVDQIAAHKIKKDSDTLTLKLVRNADILATVSALETGRPFCVGFAAETRKMEDYARAKLEEKKLDLIAANLVGGEGSGFESEQNRLEVYWTDGQQVIERASKSEVAKQLIDLIAERYTSRRS
jgi:phosphopantothenoylcysteine decarboxylase / phosphopantothenate---cysteine ligase